MELEEMYIVMEKGNERFRDILKIEDEKQRSKLIKGLASKMIGYCGSNFEEQCVIENFRWVLNEHYGMMGKAV